MEYASKVVATADLTTGIISPATTTTASTT